MHISDGKMLGGIRFPVHQHFPCISNELVINDGNHINFPNCSSLVAMCMFFFSSVLKGSYVFIEITPALLLGYNVVNDFWLYKLYSQAQEGTHNYQCIQHRTYLAEFLFQNKTKQKPDSLPVNNLGFSKYLVTVSIWCPTTSTKILQCFCVLGQNIYTWIEISAL